VSVKRGHVVITTTLRPQEVRLLDHLVENLEAARRSRALRPETYLPTDGSKVTRAGLNRAAVRYALEHEDEFVPWLNNGGSR